MSVDSVDIAGEQYSSSEGVAWERGGLVQWVRFASTYVSVCKFGGKKAPWCKGSLAGTAGARMRRVIC